MSDLERVVWFEEISNDDVARVGGKNASLGEMLRSLAGRGVAVPDGFATTAAAYREFLADNELEDWVEERLQRLRQGKSSLKSTGSAIRKRFLEAELPVSLRTALARAYADLAARVGRDDPDVAVRSSATAEDLPEASFAGQQESFLNISGVDALVDACRRCYASLFTDRAISYREDHGFDHLAVALSVGVQRMVRADRGGAGVMFSIDTETGFPGTVLINAAWGLGESVVQGSVDPDEYLVFKPLLEQELRPIVTKKLGRKQTKIVYASRGKSPTRQKQVPKRERARFVLSDDEILTLARWAVIIEDHYGRPMDMEWARDGESEQLFVVQARPETVQSRRQAGQLHTYRLHSKGKKLLEGLSVGDAIASGPVCALESPDQSDQFQRDAVLVAEMTDPDWVPLMKRAAAIVTEHGGRTSHAAIVSRELGLPAVVGARRATGVLEDDQTVTVSCAEGDRGFVYAGEADYEVQDIDLGEIPETRTEVMLNLANPDAALRWWRLPADGVGLARMEFIIGNQIRVHPLALLRPKAVKDAEVRRQIRGLTRGYDDPAEYFVERLSRGIARIAAVCYPRPAIVRMSDFKTNEYADLLGGQAFEPQEENPMLGWRGASRYYSEGYREGFDLECRAIRRVRETLGFDNVRIMIPFCRTPDEADRVLAVLAENQLVRGQHGLEVYVMCEIPANAILAEEFAERFDGFSIGSNDLTQLTLGVDRDSDRLAPLFDERNPAVESTIRRVIEAAHGRQRKVGLCGQAPSDHPEFAAFLVRAGIDSVSVSPDSFLAVKRAVARAEERLREAAGE